MGEHRHVLRHLGYVIIAFLVVMAWVADKMGAMP